LNQGAGFDANTEVPNFLQAFFRQRNTDYRKQGFFEMLHDTLCPNLTLRSFIIIISIVDVLSYIICLIGAGVGGNMLNPKVFLGVPDEVLRHFNKNPAKIVSPNWQIYRLITAVFLHVGFTHLA